MSFEQAVIKYFQDDIDLKIQKLQEDIDAKRVNKEFTEKLIKFLETVNTKQLIQHPARHLSNLFGGVYITEHPHPVYHEGKKSKNLIII
jgi:hypothetical protein